MKITILTLFPPSFSGFLDSSIIGRAQKKGLAEIEIVDLRQFAKNGYGSVDDRPYGGGVGMVLRVDVVADAIKRLRQDNSHVILLTPQGEKLQQAHVRDLTNYPHLILICGHYEGFDERIRDYVDEELSIGDYILTGGELAAAVVTEAVVRLIPGVLSKKEASENESFSENLLEHPQYTRPAEYDGKKVPEILISGHHAGIEKWRAEQSLKKTKTKRPDLN